MSSCLRICLASLGTLILSSYLPAAEPSAADAEFFENRIRPVLVEHCQECHGAKEQNGGLRLDSKAALMAGGDQGAALQADKPAESLLLKAIGNDDEDLQMPPEGKLEPQQIADLTEWVKRGAPWPGDTGAVAVKKPGEMVFTDAMKSHWAFQPVAKPELPAGPPTRNPIDAFLNQRLTSAGLAPAPPADARTLSRRLTFDLTGLPPTPEEVSAFVAECGTSNPTPDVVEKLVARLLDSPHHGERYARHWLDVARYADSNGSEVDHAMANAWRYRDYVVRAFNADLPFDQFVREQIAADLLPGAAPDALAATGFLMLGPKALAELDKDKLRADVVDEQVDTVGRAFLGLTMGCCRCHDHKFDPLPTADYYALAGIFRSTRAMDYSKRVSTWTERPIGEAAELARVEELMERIGDLKKQKDAGGAGKQKRPKLVLAAKENFLLIEAEHFARANVRVETDQLGKGIGVLRTLMEYPDHIEYEFDVEKAGDYRLELRYASKESRPVEVTINGNLVEMAAAGETTGDWAAGAQRWFVQGVYAFQKGKNLLAIHRDGPVPLFDKLLIGRTEGKPFGPDVPNAPVVRVAESKNNKQLDMAITAAQRELEAIPTVLAPLDGPGTDAPIFIRGNPTMVGAIVPRGFPRIVTGVTGTAPGPDGSGRLELAEWLTAPNHPLTPRVIVNRVWQWHFGQGLVRSPDNFGLRGETPSHPELLDWLATWFVENGWSLKKLHTLICTSEAYGRATSDQVMPADPENRLLAHFPRRRLSAEELRDAMLSLSGQLDRTVGGSLMTVLNRTYASGGTAPADIVKQMHYDAPRRSIYLPIIRTNLNEFLTAFDYPDPAMLTGQRGSTTVAPQALFLMNSPFVQGQAATLAKRLKAFNGDDAERLTAAYELAFNHPPTADETRSALAYLDQESAVLKAVGDKQPRESAWARLCHALLMSNEFLYVR